MAMPKKGCRQISVGGQMYRWRVSPHDGDLALMVERADEAGQRLEAYFLYHDRYEPVGLGAARVVGQRRSIGPGTARAVIEAGLANGWQPTRRGLGVFRFGIPIAEWLVPVGKDAARTCVPGSS